MVTSGEFWQDKLTNNLQQIQGITYYSIQALHDHTPTDQRAVENVSIFTEAIDRG